MNIDTNDIDFNPGHILADLRAEGRVFAVFRAGASVSCWILDSFLGDAMWRGVDRTFGVGEISYPIVARIHNKPSPCLIAQKSTSSLWREVLLETGDSVQSLRNVIDWVRLVNDTPLKTTPISVVGF